MRRRNPWLQTRLQPVHPDDFFGDTQHVLRVGRQAVAVVVRRRRPPISADGNAVAQQVAKNY